MVTRDEYLNRFRRAREKRVVKKAGKKLIWDEEKMIEALAEDMVPVQMQHCILRVHPKMSGKPKDRFLSAFNICGSVFQKYGYMRKNSFKLNAKGVKNERRHKRETEASSKRTRYLALVKKLWGASIRAYENENRRRGR